ncbi:50S ribosomal protein L16 [archaeon]
MAKKSKRPARCYKKPPKHAYTRTAKRVVKKAFVRGVPNIVIFHFDMGKSGKAYKYIVKLVSKNPVQVRHNALEATRIVVNRTIQKTIGVENYHFQIRIYPHHVMRENAIISGAGADRLQTGMRHAFGRPIGKAARVKRNQAMMTIKVNTKANAEKARAAFKKITAKLPTPCAIVVEELKK